MQIPLIRAPDGANNLELVQCAFHLVVLELELASHLVVQLSHLVVFHQLVVGLPRDPLVGHPRFCSNSNPALKLVKHPQFHSLLF